MSRWLWTLVSLATAATVTVVVCAIRRARSRRRPDAAFRAQRPVVKFAGYDQAKAVAGRARWQRESPTGRPWRPGAKAGRPAIAPPPSHIRIVKRSKRSGVA